MHLSTLRDALSQFERAVRAVISVECAAWIPSIDARWLDQRDGAIHGRFGVYVYATQDGEVIYIGKAQETAINQRVWAHLRTPCREREKSLDRLGLKLYPQHEWRNVEESLVAIANVVERGEVTIEALELRPNYVAGLFECFALTFCQLTEGRLPPFNRKLG